MRFSEIINESPEQGWIHFSDCEIDVHDYSSEQVELTIGFDEDAYIAINVDIDVDAREVDAGFGYEYGSESGYHDQTDVEGGVEIEGYSVAVDFYKENGASELRGAARSLRVPGRQAKNPHVVLKYFEHAYDGGKQKLLSDINTYIQDSLAETIIDNHLENQRNYHPDY